jgi:hypothetical protein
LMKRYEAPHIEARSRISGQYERTGARLPTACGLAARLG